MKAVNTETGKDVTRFVIQYLDKKITKEEFELKTGLKAENMRIDLKNKEL